MQVISTAGHVDHGKSTLLRALTGMEPDRWAEERSRGLTIDLGFVWTRIGGRTYAFVDVPGHERFIGNMLSGIGGTSAVLFVVAADAGWQPQSQEHLEIITALGIRRGILAVTRTDLADGTRAMEDAARRLRLAGLDLPALPVSAESGAGMDGLRAALGSLDTPPADPSHDVRFWLDRVFTVTGRGTVLTGTLREGTIREGDRLHLPDGVPVTVRGLHCLGRGVRHVSGPARVAINIRERLRPRRGDCLLTPGRWLGTGLTDVRPDDTGHLPGQMICHLGTAAVAARVRPLGADHARLTLSRPLPLRIGDRLVLRDPGNRHITGATVLDVLPPPLGRRRGSALRGQELAGYGDGPDGRAELGRRGLIKGAELQAMGADPPCAPVAGDWLADPGHWSVLADRLSELVDEHAGANSGAPGLPPEAARRALGLPDLALITALARERSLRMVDGRLLPAGRLLPPPTQRLLDALLEELRADPFQAPGAERISALGLSASALRAAEATGQIHYLDGSLVLLPDTARRALDVLAALPQPFTAADARKALRTSRRVLIPLLEHLDRHGHTVCHEDRSRTVRARL